MFINIHKGKGRGIPLLFLDHSTRRGEWSASRLGRFLPPPPIPGKDPVPIVQEAGRAPGPVWTSAENLAPHRDSIPGPNIHKSSVKCPLFASDFNETSNFLDFFFSQNARNVEFHENPSSGSRVVPCWQTDVVKKTGAFRSFWGRVKESFAVYFVGVTLFSNI